MALKVVGSNPIIHPRKKNRSKWIGSFFCDNGIRKSDPTAGRVKKCPGDTFLARGRVPGVPNASRRGVGGAPAFPEKSKIAKWVVVGADPDRKSVV